MKYFIFVFLMNMNLYRVLPEASVFQLVLAGKLGFGLRPDQIAGLSPDVQKAYSNLGGMQLGDLRWRSWPIREEIPFESINPFLLQFKTAV